MYGFAKVFYRTEFYIALDQVMRQYYKLYQQDQKIKELYALSYNSFIEVNKIIDAETISASKIKPDFIEFARCIYLKREIEKLLKDLPIDKG